MEESPAADWGAVLQALEVLEARQTRTRLEVEELKAHAARRLALAGREYEEEIAGLRAAQATSAIQFERQSRALARHASVATRQSSAARKVAKRSSSLLQRARAEGERMRLELSSAHSTLALREREAQRLRKRVGKLEDQLVIEARSARDARAIVGKHADLLDEVARVLVC